MPSPGSTKFRTTFQEFASLTRFPASMVDYWLDIGSKLVNADRWGSLTENGVFMFAAHNVTLERRAMDEAFRGAAPGMSSGPVNNKSVDKVSVGYDTAGGQEPDAGHWNLTIYGTRYIHLLRLMGAGGLQLGAGFDPTSPLNSENAWPGPWPWNFPNPS